MRICGRVDEADGALAHEETLLVDEGDDAAKRWRRGRGTKDQTESAVDSDHVVGTVGGDVRETAGLLAVVEAVRAVWWWEIPKPVLDSRFLVAGKREDVGESAAGEDDSFTGGLWLCVGRQSSEDVSVVLNLSGAHRCNVWACAWERRVEDAVGAVGVCRIRSIARRPWFDALTTVASNTVVARRVQDTGTEETQLHVLVALADLVCGSEVGLIVAIRGADDFRRREATAILWALVAAWVWVRVDSIFGRVVASAVGGVQCVKEVIEASTLDKIADLIEGDLLRVDKGHAVLEIEVRLAVEVERLVLLLDDRAVDEISDRSVADLLNAEVGEEEIQVRRDISLRRILYDSVAVALNGLVVRSKAVQSTKAVRGDLLVAIFQLLD